MRNNCRWFFARISCLWTKVPVLPYIPKFSEYFFEPRPSSWRGYLTQTAKRYNLPSVRYFRNIRQVRLVTVRQRAEGGSRNETLAQDLYGIQHRLWCCMGSHFNCCCVRSQQRHCAHLPLGFLWMGDRVALGYDCKGRLPAAQMAATDGHGSLRVGKIGDGPNGRGALVPAWFHSVIFTNPREAGASLGRYSSHFNPP